MYNGHKNYAAWNTCLWLYNEESYYRLAQKAVKIHKTKDQAADWLLSQLPESTPDGVKFNKTNLRYALSDI